MASGDYFKKCAKEKILFRKVCTSCDWKGELGFFNRKCPECGNLNLKNIGTKASK